MRRHREKSERRKKFYISLFIVAVMVLSTLGFVASYGQGNINSGGTDYSYNGIEFTQLGNQWQTTVDTPFGEQDFTFFYHPLHFTTTVPSEITEAITASPDITLTFDPNITQVQFIDAGRFQLSNYLINNLGKNVEHATTSNTTAYALPVLTCTSGQTHITITYREGESGISQENNCITIQSYSSVDYLQYSEQIIYKLLGVIE
jgi:hypothetical protein